MSNPFTTLSPMPNFDRLFQEADQRTLFLYDIGAMLALSGGNVTKAAKRCRLERQALQQIMKRFQISADKFR